jgi:hypothetical protein
MSFKMDWGSKQLLFGGYADSGSHRVPVYEWYSPSDRAFITDVADEWSDEQLRQKGYNNKRLLFYASTKPGNNTIGVYRWVRNGSWLSVPGNVKDTAMHNQGYSHKTFEFYALVK